MATRLVFSPCTEDKWREAHEKLGSVYFILDADNNRVKVGHSRDPWKRLRQLQTGSSAKLKLIGIIAGNAEVEKRLHADLREHRVQGEWFAEGEQAIDWLNRQTGGNPICRMAIFFAQAREVEVFWEWDAEHNVHHKHVYDEERKQWFGPLMYSGRPAARPGWSANAKELAPA